MYLGLRDIRHATGRFGLIAAVIGLLTVLLVMLTGLTQGLARENTSALDALNPDRVVFAAASNADAKVDFSASRIDAPVAEAWRSAPGVDDATELGVTQTRMESAQTAEPVAVMGLPAGAKVPGTDQAIPADGSLIVPDELDFATSEEVSVGGVDLKVASKANEDLDYSHLPVAWTNLDTWKQVAHADAPTVLLLNTNAKPDKQAWSDLEKQTNAKAVDLSSALKGLPAYNSERGSLLSMQGLLYGISALVVIAFLSVWTIQRTRDIAVLRALGASRSYVLRDALGQAAIVVSVGVAIGAAIAVGLGALAASAVPFELSWMTTAVPALAVFALGIIGSVVAVRRVAGVDPQLALN